MKLAIFGAAGKVGSRVAAEAASRGHHVVPVVRDAARLGPEARTKEFLIGDVTDPRSVAIAVKGMDAIISASAVGPYSGGSGADVVVAAAEALIAGAQEAGVRRVILVGGAGSLEIAPGLQEVDRPDFPPHVRGQSLAQREALAIFSSRADGLDWTYISPPRTFVPGNRTGRYRVGFDQMIFDSNGVSAMSMEDYAVALVDELEAGAHPKQRIAVSY